MVMKRMHGLPELVGVPVVMISGRDPERYRDEALAAGAVAYLTKPVEADVLVTVLRRALGEDEQTGAGAPAGPHADKLVLLVDLGRCSRRPRRRGGTWRRTGVAELAGRCGAERGG